MNKTISMQEIRKDVPGFLERIAAGDTITVIYHSKPLVTVASAGERPVPPPRGTQHFLDLAAEAHTSAKGVLDPKKSIKKLYAETAGSKYGIR